MPERISEGQRRARKQHHCGMCGIAINPGDLYDYQTNVYDGRIYTWRDCLACARDLIVNYVSDWTGGYYDEGVGQEQAMEWADEAVVWPKHWWVYGRTIHPVERLAARNFLARLMGGEGE